MASAAVFRLMVNDGKADKMIMATDMLDCRVQEITEIRLSEGYTDGEELPTLLDIEQTHILFINAHFRPFAAIAYEYAKIRTNSGNATYGGSVTFDVPQQGDFFHDMVLHATLSQASATTSIYTLPANISLAAVTPFGVATDNSLNLAAADGSPLGTAAGLGVAGVTYDVVDLSLNNVLSNAVATTVTRQGALHYCDLPGARLLKKVAFTVSGNPLDDYNSDSYVWHDKFRVQPNKRFGWNRCMGQENVVQGESNHLVMSADTANAGETSRRAVSVLRGAQTPKLVQPALEMWIPFLFWFCGDVRQSIASVSIPNGQRWITVDIQDQNKVLYLTPSMRLRAKVYAVRNSAGAANTVTGGNVGGVVTLLGANSDDYNQARGYTIYYDIGSSLTRWDGNAVDGAYTLGSLPTQTFSTFDLYINHIYLNPNVHDIFVERIGFSLIRIHRTFSVTKSVSDEDILMSSFKFPIEYFYVGLRPTTNGAATNANSDKDWHRFTQQTSQNSTESASVTVPDAGTLVGGAGTVRAAAANEVPTGIVNYRWSTKMITSLTVTAHSVVMYNTYNSSFFDTYLPMQYGGPNVATPNEEGACFVNFCFHPGSYQPSGHMNISRSREFRVAYSSALLGGSVLAADFVSEGSAINFLLISDGSAVLRYST